MTPASAGQANRLLGYPSDARLLILNADDFGFCHAINEGIIGVLQAGVIRSTTVMAPCPRALEAMQYLFHHPEISCGVHLTVMSDPTAYRWGPLTSPAKVPSLVDQAGYFYNFDNLHARLAQVKLDELEIEFKAQIEAVLAAGLQPDHLDWHALRFGQRTDIFELMIRLAKDYGLALRVIGRAWIETLQHQGLPTIDYDFLDSYSIEPGEKAARFARMLRDLPPGLSEWAIHPGLDNDELRAIEPGGSRFRQADYDFWTSPLAKEIVEGEGIILLDYRALQPWWRQP
jgi:hypothetical protein